MEKMREIHEVSIYAEDTVEELTLEPLKNGEVIEVAWDEQGIIRFEP